VGPVSLVHIRVVGHHLLLIPIAFLAVATVRDDLRHGKIFNRRILQGLAAGAVAYGILFVGEILGMDPALCCSAPEGETWHWGYVALLNLGVGLGVGILLWLLGIWAAGDAKLFAVYAFLVPPAVYTRSYLDGFPALPVLVNIFALVFLFLIIDLLRTGVPAVLGTISDPERRTAAVKAAPRWLLGLLPAILVLTAMFAGIRTVREVSREGLARYLEVSDFTMFMILFVVFRPLMRLVRSRWGAIVFGTLASAALVYLIIVHEIGDLPGILTPSAFAVALLIFARAYPGFGQTSVKLTVGDLRPGMFLGPETLGALQARQAKEIEEQGEEALPADEAPGSTAVPSRFGRITVEGLTAEQVRYIRTRYDDDQPILVARTIPFSPFLAAGVILTYVLGGPLTMFVSIH
jgi:preflagellin peptidase FlaK